MAAGSNDALVRRVRTWVADDPNVNAFTLDVLFALEKAVDEFNIEPDEYADIRRMPLSVTSLDTLVAHLRSIKVKLAGRPTGVVNANWDVAKSGELRSYKQFACCIRALYIAVCHGQPNGVPLSEFVNGVLVTASGNPPKALSSNARTLWNKTIDPNNSRTKVDLSLLVQICQQTNTTRLTAGGTWSLPLVAKGVAKSPPSKPKPTPTI